MKTGMNVTALITADTIMDETRKAASKMPDLTLPSLSSFFNEKSNRVSLVVDFQKAQRKKSGGLSSLSQKFTAVANRALHNVPDGFELKPLVYTRVSTKQNKVVYEEFRRKVRPRFYQYLAQTQKRELRAMGICEYGIRRMAKGQHPRNRDGRDYAVSIDHIIERSGAGQMSYEKAQDPLMNETYKKGQTTPEIFKVNHFSNLILLPDHIHFDRKNVINEIQQLQKNVRPGESIWALMMIPKRTKQNGLFAYFNLRAVNDNNKHAVPQGMRLKKMAAGPK